MCGDSRTQRSTAREFGRDRWMAFFTGTAGAVVDLVGLGNGLAGVDLGTDGRATGSYIESS
jgi:hypothetical protein